MYLISHCEPSYYYALYTRVKASKKMVVKVYGSVRAACPQRVMACLMEFDVDFELINVDLDSNEHKQPDFLKKQVHFILRTICYNLQ